MCGKFHNETEALNYKTFHLYPDNGTFQFFFQAPSFRCSMFRSSGKSSLSSFSFSLRRVLKIFQASDEGLSDSVTQCLFYFLGEKRTNQRASVPD